MQFTAIQIAQLVTGIIEGNPETTVNQFYKIEEGKPNGLSFLANPKYEAYIYTTESSIVLVNNNFQATQAISATLIRVPDAYAAFATLLHYYQQLTNTAKVGIEQPCYIDATATMGKEVYIGAFVYIGKNVTIGDNVQLYPHTYIGDNCVIQNNTTLYSGVKVYDATQIGKYCTIHSGVVIGADGFGFAPTNTEAYQKIPQIGNVVLEDYVEIGANTTIDRATMGSTIIRTGVKLDNLIQIAHNVEIGRHTVMAALSGVSGSSKIGANCMIAGQVGVVGHTTIGDNVKIGGQSGVNHPIPSNSIVQGAPAVPIREFQKKIIYTKRLEEVFKKLDL